LQVTAIAIKAEKGKKSGLQSEDKLVYNHSIAVTPTWLSGFRFRHATVITNKKEDCSER
jgi:hypothetical protein